MKVYLAGPMRGIPEFNYPNFHRAAKRLRARGYVVFNPAEADIQRTGHDVSKGNKRGCEKLAAKKHGFDIRAALAEDMEFICRHADAIALLPGWEQSRGATAEYHTARALNLKVIEL